jgi:hypothetical protein
MEERRDVEGSLCLGALGCGRGVIRVAGGADAKVSSAVLPGNIGHRGVDTEPTEALLEAVGVIGTFISAELDPIVRRGGNDISRGRAGRNLR